MSKDVSIELVNLKEVQASINNYGNDARTAVIKAIHLTGKAIESTAKLRLRGRLDSARHWVTGRLTTSVHMEHNMDYKDKNTYKSDDSSGAVDGILGIQLEDMEAAVGTNVEYAGKIEFDYDSFLRYAAEKQEPKYIKQMTEEFNKIAAERKFEG